MSSALAFSSCGSAIFLNVISMLTLRSSLATSDLQSLMILCDACNALTSCCKCLMAFSWLSWSAEMAKILDSCSCWTSGTLRRHSDNLCPKIPEWRQPRRVSSFGGKSTGGSAALHFAVAWSLFLLPKH